jgi:DNA-binding XRE family transcriptional regulator
MGRKPTREEDLILNNLEANRTRLGLSRQELADRVGVHYQTMGYLERGEYSPSLVLALRLAQVLGVSIEQLFTLKEETNDATKE